MGLLIALSLSVVAFAGTGCDLSDDGPRERYQYINLETLVNHLGETGWQVVDVSHMGSRTITASRMNADFTVESLSISRFSTRDMANMGEFTNQGTANSFGYAFYREGLTMFFGTPFAIEIIRAVQEGRDPPRGNDNSNEENCLECSNFPCICDDPLAICPECDWFVVICRCCPISNTFPCECDSMTLLTLNALRNAMSPLGWQVVLTPLPGMSNTLTSSAMSPTMQMHGLIVIVYYDLNLMNDMYFFDNSLASSLGYQIQRRNNIVIMGTPFAIEAFDSWQNTGIFLDFPLANPGFFRITFNTNGGTPISSIEIIAGSSVTVPATIKGLTPFLGWYFDENFTQPLPFGWIFVPTNHTTVHARWHEYNLYFNTRGGNIIEARIVHYMENVTRASMPIPIRDNFYFVRWNTNSALTTIVPLNVITNGHRTVYASWEQRITFNTNGGNNLSNQWVLEGNSLSNLPTPVRANYRFLGWYHDENFILPVAQPFTPNGNTTLYARWIRQFTISLNLNGGGGFDLTPVAVDVGSVIAELPYDPIHRLNYSFRGWYINNVPLVLPHTITQNITITAMWNKTYIPSQMIDTANSHNLMIDTQGRLFAWGYNGSGRLGNGSTEMPLNPINIMPSLRFNDVAAGWSHSHAIDRDGRLWSWGNNFNGRLGDGTEMQRLTPVNIMPTLRFVSVSTNNMHSLAITTDGRLFAWGSNEFGQIGSGTIISTYHTPVQIGGDLRFSQIAAGHWHSLAITTDGRLFAWGRNHEGMLGDNSTTLRRAPVHISTANTFKAISGGSLHSLAIATDGRLFGWGLNTNGRVGDGTQTRRLLPVNISTANRFTAVSAGNAHSMAIHNDGRLFAWGNNANSRLGDGTTTQRLSPVVISSAQRFVSISAGDLHSIAINSQGSVVATGSNANLRLGLIFNAVGDFANASVMTTIVEGNARQISFQTGMTPNKMPRLFSQNSSIISSDIPTPERHGYNFVAWYLDNALTQPVQFPFNLSDDVTFHARWLSWPTITFNTMGGNPLAPQRHQFGTILTSLPTPTHPNFHYGLVGWYIGTTPFALPHTLTADITIEARWETVLVTSSMISSAWHNLMIDAQGRLFSWGPNGQGRLGDGTTTTRQTPVHIRSDITFTYVSYVSAGRHHSHAIDTYGRLWGWGNNGSGRLGDGTTIQRNSPVQIGGANRFVSVSGGWEHTLAIDTYGRLWAWGSNVNGRLGDGTTTQRNSPVLVNTTERFKAASAGGSHSVAITTDGRAFAWGFNGQGRLGDGTTTNRSNPVHVGGGNRFSVISAGFSHTLAIHMDGRAFAWGEGTNGRLGNGSVQTANSSPIHIGGTNRFSEISAGEAHSLAIATDGRLFAWGLNGSGRLGDNTINQRTTPTHIATERTFRSISAGVESSMAVDTKGSIFAWGSNNYGNFGNGTTLNSSIPLLIMQGDGVIISFNTGGARSIRSRIVATGTLFNIETEIFYEPVIPFYNFEGWYFDEDFYYPVTAPFAAIQNTTLFARFSSIPIEAGVFAAFGAFTFKITDDGFLYAWGANASGQLGDGTTTQRNYPVPIMPNLRFRAVDGGSAHSMALDTYGRLWVWGNGGSGRLGNGDTENVFIPINIMPHLRFAYISAGFLHSAAIDVYGRLWTWGSNQFGRLGDGTTTNRSTPVAIRHDLIFLSVSAGGEHTLAIDRGRRLWAWGCNCQGFVGDGTTAQRSSPINIRPDLQFNSASAGSLHSVAVDSLGRLWGWGLNTSGQVGDGTNTRRLAPVQINAYGKQFISVATKTDHNLALDTNGGLWTWGHGGSGRLGNGSTGNILAPLQILSSPHVITSFSAGDNHSIAKSEDGVIFVWGGNAFGQLGLDDNSGYRSVPAILNPEQLQERTIRVWFLGGRDGHWSAFGAAHMRAFSGTTELMARSYMQWHSAHSIFQGWRFADVVVPTSYQYFRVEFWGTAESIAPFAMSNQIIQDMFFYGGHDGWFYYINLAPQTLRPII